METPLGSLAQHGFSLIRRQHVEIFLRARRPTPTIHPPASSIVFSLPPKATEMASILWLPVIGWLVAPIISFFVNKLLSYPRFYLSRKFRELELDIVPSLMMP
jgi:hypothetical protein